MSIGHLHLKSFDSILGSTIKNSRPKAAFFMSLVYTLYIELQYNYEMHIRPHPYGCVRMHMESPTG